MVASRYSFSFETKIAILVSFKRIKQSQIEFVELKLKIIVFTTKVFLLLLSVVQINKKIGQAQ